MSNRQINSFPAASTIDATNDYFLIDPANSGNYNKINRNTILGITGTPADISTVQTFTNKTIGNTNSITVLDGSFTLQNTGATTKQATLSLSSITAGQTRVITVPDANTTLPIATQVVTIAGQTAPRTYTFADSAVTIADTSTTQTLTNKTLTSSTNVLGGVTMTLGSDASGDVYYRNSSGVLTRVASVGAQNTVFTMGAGSVPSWAASTSQVTLLKANSGTDTSAGATTVDTFSITGLTAKDTLKIYYSVSSQTQPTAALSIYGASAAVKLCPIANNASLAANNIAVGEAVIRQDPVTATTYNAVALDTVASSGSQNGALTTGAMFGGIATGTAWTGSWSIGIRHGGVTAGGTLYWSWSLYKVAGQ